MTDKSETGEAVPIIAVGDRVESKDNGQGYTITDPDTDPQEAPDEGDLNAFVSDLADEMADDLDDMIDAAVEAAEEKAAAFHIMQLRALEARHDEEKLIAYGRGLKDAARKYEADLTAASEQIDRVTRLRFCEAEAHERALDEAIEDAYQKGHKAGARSVSADDGVAKYTELHDILDRVGDELARARAIVHGKSITFAALVEGVDF